jgi:hypothetical protein
MPEVSVAPVIGLLGWKITDDRSHVLLGFKQPEDGEFTLAVSEPDLREMIMSLAHATEAFPAPKVYRFKRWPWKPIGTSSERTTRLATTFCA